MAATVLAMAVANSPGHGSYKALLDRPLGIGVGALRIDKPLLLWINDGLTAVYVRWSQLYGITLLCGIGFTMSLLIASLAFEEGGAGMVGLERLGIVVGSLLAGLGGYIVFRFFIDARTGDHHPLV